MATDKKLAKKEQTDVVRREAKAEYFQPAVDISETSEVLFLKYDIPGVEKGDVEITADKNTLAVTGNVKSKQPGNAVYLETRIGNYRREFTIPDDVDTNKISAEMNEGVLTITIPKPEKAKPKRIKITSG